MAVHITDGNTYGFDDSAIVTAYPFSWGTWFKVITAPTSSATEVILQYADNSLGDTYYRIDIVDSSGLKMNIITRNVADGNNFTTSAATVSTAVWHSCIAVHRDATDHELYLDGTSIATQTVSTGFTAGIDSLGIGHESESGPTIPLEDGDICETAMWDVELTENEITSIANGVSANMIRPASLVGYWPLYNNNHLSDFSPNNTVLTKTGTPTSVDHAPVGRQVHMPHPPQRRVRSTDDALIFDKVIPV